MSSVSPEETSPPQEHSDLPAWQQDRIGSALRGENPTVIMRLPMAFAVLGDVQFLPGYCVLLVDREGVDNLGDLDPVERSAYLASLAQLDHAVRTACRALDPAFRRTNLEILGNADEFLHAHVWPRYSWEPAQLIHQPVWKYPSEFWTLPTVRLGPQHDGVRLAITRELHAGR